MRLFLLLNVILILSTSCSVKNDVEFPYNAEREFSVDDYQKHLKQLAVNFIKNNKGYVYKVSYRTNKYLSKISNRIISNNESLFDKRKLFFVKKSEIWLLIVSFSISNPISDCSGSEFTLKMNTIK